MKSNGREGFPGFVLLFAVALACLLPRSAAAEAFTLTASNATIPASGGIGVSTFKIQGIPLTGTIILSCTYAGAPGVVRLPLCPLTPPVAYSVTAGGTLAGQVAFYRYGSAVPADETSKKKIGFSMAIGLFALAGLRKRFRYGLTVLLFAVCGLGACVSLTACGGNGFGGTQGTFPFTITAANAAGPTLPSGAITSTTVSVTVQ